MDANNITAKCRICLVYCNRMVNLFGSEFKYKFIIEEFTGVKLEQQTGLPSMICDYCIDTVKILLKFKATFIKTQELLKNQCITFMNDKTVENDTMYVLKNEINSEDEREANSEDEKEANSEDEKEENSEDEKEANSEDEKEANSEDEKEVNFGDLFSVRSAPESPVKESDEILESFSSDNDAISVNKDTQDKSKKSVQKKTNKSAKKTPKKSTTYSKQKKKRKSRHLSDEDDNPTEYSDDSTKLQKLKKMKKSKKKTEEETQETDEETQETEELPQNSDPPNPNPTPHLKNWKAYEIPCHMCGKFFERHKIQFHINSHLGQRPFACKVEGCKSAFFSPQHLRQHNKHCHSDYAPFVCDVCGKAFKANAPLKLHKTYHNDPHLPCNICGKLYKNDKALKKHMLSHTGDRRHKCLDCSKCFRDKWSLKMHLKVHTKHTGKQQSIKDNNKDVETNLLPSNTQTNTKPEDEIIVTNYRVGEDDPQFELLQTALTENTNYL